MATIHPYLTFNGNCEEAFNFYKSVFGGDFPYVGRYKDMPPTEGHTAAPEDGEKIMHMSLPIGKGIILMGSDSTKSFGGDAIIGNNIALSINADSKEEADKLFNGLSAGGKVGMPMGDTFWEAYFGMCTDKFGINGMVNFDTNPNKMK